jgi:hypothetical protein
VPWWGAVLIGVTTATLGFAFDAGSGGKELSNVFAGLYVAGCVAAVLAVRQSGIFTAVIQPPLILFAAVPGSYFLFHGAKFTGIKDTLINCGYPLIERFPLMLFTSAAVLLIGMARWYFGMGSRSAVSAKATAKAATGEPAAGGRLSGLMSKLSSLRAPSEDTEDAADVVAAAEAAEQAPRRKHAIDRPATAAKRPRTARPAKRPAPTRSRHVRPPLDDASEPPPERPRRRRPTHAADFDAAPEPPAEPPRRRPRPPSDPGLRNPPPLRRDPHERRDPPECRDPNERRSSRSARFDPYQPAEPYEPPPPARRRPPATSGTNGSSTHHPVSRVRYRGSGVEDGENRTEYRSRARRPRDHGAETWEYDV